MINKRKVIPTMFANSTDVLLDDVLGMASVEFANSAKSNDYMVAQLLVANS